jgi:CRP/FNR family transcriptional regulator, cyclic AMP receptor protein
MREDFIETLLPHATTRTFKKGSVVLYQGEAPRMAYIIKTGTIKVYTINNAGEEQIVTMHGAGDMFPSPWLFNKASVSLYYYETIVNTTILTVPRDVLRKMLFLPKYMPMTVDYLVTNYTGMLMRTTALEQSRASEKIMFTMYYLMTRYGQQVKEGMYEIQLPLTHNTIASLVGLTRETTTTELNRLKRQKVVKYARHLYTVDKPRLERLLGEDSFAELKL